MKRRIFLKVWRLPWKFVVVFLLAGTVMYTGMIYNAARETLTEVEALSWALAQKVVIVDPGHGGRDPGAVGPSGALEKDITLAIGKKLVEKLGQAGAMVILTRETDTDLVQPGEGTMKKRDLDSRLSIVEKHHAELYVSIQANALASRQWRGAQTFYFGENKEGEKLAKAIQAELIGNMGNTDRQALEKNSTYMLKKLTIPAALVEVGFMSNPEEERLLRNPEYQDKLAFAIYTGIARYLAGEHR